MPKATKTYNLQAIKPKLTKEWHPTKNGTLKPEDVTPYSGKEVWWICHKKHEWKTIIRYRSKGSECPYCSGRIACEESCLQTLNPKLARQWHPIKNGALTPKDVTLFSGRKVWWVCNRKHEWKTPIYRRSYGFGCPFCSGHAVCRDNCLQTKYPKLSKEWHPTKNGQLTPKDITPGNHSRVWWICRYGHEWEAVVATRVRKTGCPYCSGRLATKDNNLAILKPKLSKEWHPTKNGDLTPNNVLPYSGKKVWWLCKNGHEWRAVVATRTNGCGCPACSQIT